MYVVSQLVTIYLCIELVFNLCYMFIYVVFLLIVSQLVYYLFIYVIMFSLIYLSIYLLFIYQLFIMLLYIVIIYLFIYLFAIELMLIYACRYFYWFTEYTVIKYEPNWNIP